MSDALTTSRGRTSAGVRLLAVCACLTFLCLLAALPSRHTSARRVVSAAASPRQTPAPGATLTPRERRGKSIYQRGVSPSGREIVAMMGELDVPASTLTCAGCHGARGEGKTEAGVTAGGLAWSHLAKSYGHVHPSGRKHGPFDEASFVRSVEAGIDPAGNPLLGAMPRYRLTTDEMADLIAYLRRIEEDRDPGVSEQSIVVGSVIPSHGPLSETGAAMREILAAYFDDLNSRGGIYSRRVELRVAESGPESGPAAAAAALSAREPVFAFVGGVSAGADAELAAVAAEREIPFVGPSTLLTQTGPPLIREVFYLLPGVREQARALVNFAASKPEMAKARAAVVASESNLSAAAAGAAVEQAKKAGWATVMRHDYRAGAFDAAQLVRRLRQDGAGVVFFFGHGGADAAFVAATGAAAGWEPRVLLLGTLASGELVASAPQGLGDRLFLAFPTVPEDITRAATEEFRALQAKYKVAPRHTASQLSAFAAAKVFVEALKRAGRELTREKFIAALEGLYNFDTGVTPRITFGPNRRVGAAGAHVVGIDVAKKQFVVVGGWVSADR